MQLSIKKLKEIEEAFGEFEISQMIVNHSSRMYLKFGPFGKKIDLEKLKNIIEYPHVEQIQILADYGICTGTEYSYHLEN